MRTTQENDQLFMNLMRLNTTFFWNGFELHLMGDHIEVFTKEALDELKSHTSEEFHKYIAVFEPTL